MANVAIIGAGPAGLIAAERLLAAGHDIDLHERMPSPGRKLLMAGRGGLNITHSEPLDAFLARYEPVPKLLLDAVRAFPPDALRHWLETLGQPTFVGTSGRVFPKAMKASPLLRAWLARLAAAGLRLHPRHSWQGWDDTGALLFASPDGQHVTRPDATLLALGGASWPRLGADGSWVPHLVARGIAVSPLMPANAGVTIAWSPYLTEKHAGTPLKRIALRHGKHVVRGEAVLTRDGLEGGAVYALSRGIREALGDGSDHRHAPVTLHLDLRPDLSIEALAASLERGKTRDSLPNRLRKSAALVPAAIALLHEDGPLPAEPALLAQRIKALPLMVTGLAGMDRAISTAGGIRLDQLNPGFMLNEMPGVFAAGEMLDWDAPTGGYLLQASFATGIAAAAGITRFLG